ncbi:CBS domain-containing protein [Halalkalirubrum salinum]|uniref:CBS domain-containing protein n=1 Tax=Halalkalirubrum salinum TaxID=2563889 RepID=UPI001F0CECEA|nr:CBS domain-containing protein [Halalkalirubrum salinum]
MDIFVARIMSTAVKTVTPDTLVEDAAATMLENDIGSVVVVNEENHPEGILTTTDFVQIVAERKPKDRTPVSAYMSTDVITASAQDPIDEIAEQMIEHGIHHIPVTNESEGLIGIITTTDLTAYLSDTQIANV